MRNTTLAIATAGIWLASTPAGHAVDFEETVAARAEILKSRNHTRLGACQDLMRDLYEWGVLDQVATEIAFGVTDNMTKTVKQAEATGNHQLRRGSAGFLIGFCTAIMHIHMANRNGAESLPNLPPQTKASGPDFQSRTARLQNHDTFNPDYCRGDMGNSETPT